MSKKEKESKFPPVTTVTEATYNDMPTLALPTGNPSRPVIMTLGRWRAVGKNIPALMAWLEKHKDFDVTRKAPAPVTPEEKEARRKQLLAELATL